MSVKAWLQKLPRKPPSARCKEKPPRPSGGLVLFAIRFTWDLEWIVPNDFEDQTIQNIIMTNPHIGDIRFAIFYDYAQRFNLDRKSC